MKKLSSNNFEEWDSMSHLNILIALDKKLSGKAQKIQELSEAYSVKKIIQILEIRKNYLNKLKYNLSIKCIETALPKNNFKISSLKKKNPTWDIKKIIDKTGIEKIWYTKKNQTALDLGFEASKKVLKKN